MRWNPAVERRHATTGADTAAALWVARTVYFRFELAHVCGTVTKALQRLEWFDRCHQSSLQERETESRTGEVCPTSF